MRYVMKTVQSDENDPFSWNERNRASGKQILPILFFLHVWFTYLFTVIQKWNCSNHKTGIEELFRKLS